MSLFGEYHKEKAFVSNNTGKVEWYTPPVYIEAARGVLGEIDLDPASCEIANRTVGAKKIYTAHDNGLTKPWKGRVWMNPPYAPKLVAKFVGKLVGHYRDGDIESACVLTNNASETKWFQLLINNCSAICFHRGRIKFCDPNGVAKGGPLQGQVIAYFGRETKKFNEKFSEFGCVLMNERSFHDGANLL